MASIIAVSTFALLIIPVKYNISLQQNLDEIILLTEGTNPDSVSKLKGEKYVLAPAEIKNVKAIAIPDLAYFLSSHPNIKRLNVYGYGLSENELKTLTDYQIIFHSSTVPNGIISANWYHKVKATEQQLVQGNYRNTNNYPVKLLLKGLGNAIDSISIEAKSSKVFSFANQPKHLGKAVYELIAVAGKDTLVKEPVPFLVDEQKPMKVLILASFPDFEYKFLKKWLYENQFPLAFRSQISKNKYSSDFLNMDSLSINRINSSSLKKFDILIIDEEELAVIGADEKAAIDHAVNAGMGLLIRVSNPKSATSIGARFARYESSAAKDKQLGMFLQNNNYKFSKLPLEQTLYLKASQNDEALVIDGNKKILVNSSLKGGGKILISTVSSTFNWILSGKTADYTTYWSEILSKAARKKTENLSLKVIPQFPVVNQQTKFVIDLTESGKIPLLKIDSIKLSPRQNIELPFEWDAIYWPINHGWNTLFINQSAESVYIYKSEDWKAVKNQGNINATAQYSNKTINKTADKIKDNVILKEEVSKWWFFVGFIIVCSFLWYESRILSEK